jgi:hypothetical protein
VSPRFGCRALRGEEPVMSLHSDDFEETEDTQTRRAQPESFGHRHGLKILGTVLVAMFAAVIVAQVGC